MKIKKPRIYAGVTPHDLRSRPVPAPTKLIEQDSYRQAIVTKYHPYTNTRGARVSATAEAGRLYLPWDDDLGMDGNHARAARALCDKFGWSSILGGGWLPGGGMVFVDVVKVRS